MKMITHFRRGLPPGQRVSVFGYEGIVHDDGRLIVNVPESSVKNELSSGRLHPYEVQFVETVDESPSFIDSMTVAEMREYAKEHGIPIPATATTKAEIAELLKAKEHTSNSM